MKRVIRVPGHLGEFFVAREFDAELSVDGQRIQVSVSVPDLRSVPATCWGDWGPMYDCLLVDGEEVEVSYRGEDGNAATYQLRPDVIRVHSPARLERRLRQPFYLELDDLAHGLRLRAHMNNEGVVEQVSVERLCQGHDLVRVLFGAHDAVQTSTKLRKAG